MGWRGLGLLMGRQERVCEGSTEKSLVAGADFFSYSLAGLDFHGFFSFPNSTFPGLCPERSK